jgi:hypothetical protein
VGATVWHVSIRRDGLLDRMIPPQDQSEASGNNNKKSKHKGALQSRGRRCNSVGSKLRQPAAVDMRGYVHGPGFVCHATGRNRWFAGRRARQYGRLELPKHKSCQLSRHHDSGCYLVNALDDSRREGAILLGDPRGSRSEFEIPHITKAYTIRLCSSNWRGASATGLASLMPWAPTSVLVNRWRGVRRRSISASR